MTENYTYGPGKVSTAHFARGLPNITTDCETCDCPEHDYERERPKPAGVYVEVRLDNEDARVGLERVIVLTEQEYASLRADAWDEGHRTPQRREMDDCRCAAYYAGECACGRFGTGRIITPNPYLQEARDE